jgi:hypothetical protein
MSKDDYIIVWRCAPHRQIVTSELVRLLLRWPWNTLRNYMWCRFLQEGVGGSAIRWGSWSADCGGVGKQWTEKESFQQNFYNRYKILHTWHTYCCYAYHFYAYWLYFIHAWHVYVSPKTYKWFGTFIIKDGRYTFTFLPFNGWLVEARSDLDLRVKKRFPSCTMIGITKSLTCVS